MSGILLLTTTPCETREKEIGRELTERFGVTAKTVGLFRGEAENARPLPRRVLKKQIAAAVPVLLEELLRSRPSAVYCMHYAAAIAACDARRRGGLNIPIYVSLRDRALLTPEISVSVLPSEHSELAASASAPPSVPLPPAVQECGRETARRISRALKFAAKQEKLICKYPFLVEEHLEWEL